MFGFLFPLVLTALCFLFIRIGGPWVFTPLVLSLYVLAVIDWLAPKDSHAAVPGPRGFFNAVLFIYCVLHPVLILYGASRATNSETPLYEFIGLAISVGVVTGGVGITFAHELVHRKSAFEKWLGKWLLVFVCYGHFAAAHVFGHHRNVGTPIDPATAKKGQSLYGFLFSAMPRIFLEGYRLRPKDTLILHGISLLIAAGFFAIFGWAGVVFFFAQSFMAALLLETTDYIQHYGLYRKETSPGRHENVQAQHSWDSDRFVSGKLLIHLQRHSDHHLHVVKEYPQLELIDRALPLPMGYPGMILLALTPPLWFKVMDKRLAEHGF